MDYIEERQQIVDYGKKLVDERLTTGTGGNLSIYLPEEDKMLISPSGVPYYETQLEDIVVMDLKGNILEGDLKPSSEWEMHSMFYRNDSDIKSVVHAHSDYATACSTLHISIPALHYAAADACKSIRTTEYRIYGSHELAEEAFDVMRNDHGILLANHGLLATGTSIKQAMSTAVNIEWLCKLYILAKSVGQPCPLTDNQLEKVAHKFENYGQTGKCRDDIQNDIKMHI
ncbi:class II aldolase/adducin family protein [Companilactobacillus nuruki]|uniref:Aldolase n=1 Tax=Companilactobacillus nuruki TaxID=1993540 RepID=A0A2N7AR87_9LACO|nr:class II aldolase/adducin family protein [Companilactobacillus nuruki]PMD67880.1 aldolase [Companilactobacillus nuruki]